MIEQKSRDWRDQADLRMKELAAEVERLRALVATGDFKDLYAEGLEVGKRLGSSNARTAELETEIAEHIKERSRAVADRDFFAAQSAKLEAENAELRGQLVRHEHALAAVQSENWECAKVLAQHIDWNAEQRALVTWFERYQEAVNATLSAVDHHNSDADVFRELKKVPQWERDYPKPSDGT